MRYITIDAGGDIAHPVRPLDLAAEVGPEGAAMVTVHHSLRMYAWVNDDGLNQPHRYPVNVVGSCLLAVLGAPPAPYAGTIVLTGRDQDGEITDLAHAEIIAELHDNVQRALSSRSTHMSRAWVHAVRAHAHAVETAPAPAPQPIPEGRLP